MTHDRYMTPLQLQLAMVETMFEAARTMNACTRAVLSIQSAVWRNWRDLFGIHPDATIAER